MNKILITIVCLMVMVSFTSCEKKIAINKEHLMENEKGYTFLKVEESDYYVMISNDENGTVDIVKKIPQRFILEPYTNNLTNEITDYEKITYSCFQIDDIYHLFNNLMPTLDKYSTIVANNGIKNHTKKIVSNNCIMIGGNLYKSFYFNVNSLGECNLCLDCDYNELYDINLKIKTVKSFIKVIEKAEKISKERRKPKELRENEEKRNKERIDKLFEC